MVRRRGLSSKRLEKANAVMREHQCEKIVVCACGAWCGVWCVVHAWCVGVSVCVLEIISCDHWTGNDLYFRNYGQTSSLIYATTLDTVRCTAQMRGRL